MGLPGWWGEAGVAEPCEHSGPGTRVRACLHVGLHPLCMGREEHGAEPWGWGRVSMTEAEERHRWQETSSSLEAALGGGPWAGTAVPLGERWEQSWVAGVGCRCGLPASS